MNYADLEFIKSCLSVILFLPWFLIAVLLAFYIPGKVVLGKQLGIITESQFGKCVIAITLGIVIWSFQGALVGYLQLRFLSYLYILFFLVLWLRKNITVKIPKLRLRLKSVLIAIFLLGIFAQNQQFLITAFKFSDGIHSFTVSVDDSFWHTGLTNSLIKSFPPIEPGMTGMIVKNYHYWSNLVTADLVRVFALPLFPTQYVYMGILVSTLLGSLAYFLGKDLKLSALGVGVLVYLQYFSSDIIYILTLFTRGMTIFNVHPLEDGTMLLENPPRAFSFVILLLGIIILREWLRNYNVRLGMLTILLFGTLIGFKVHTGATALFGLGVLVLYLALFKNKKSLMLLPSFFIAALVYLPVNAGAGGALFVPFEMTSRNFAVQQGLGLSNFELARRVYLDHSNFLQALRMDVTMFILYVVSQFGIKMLGIIPFRRAINLIGFPTWLFLYSGVVFSFIFGVLFIQPVAPADIFNSLLAGSFLLAILTAVSLDVLLKDRKKLARILVILILIGFTLPRWIYKTSSIGAYFKTASPIISKEELSATEYLRKTSNPSEIVLVFNDGQWDKHFSYVSILSGNQMFLSGQVIMSRHGIDFTSRESEITKLRTTRDPNNLRQLISRNNISYLYFYNYYDLNIATKEAGLVPIFKNNKIIIYSTRDDK